MATERRRARGPAIMAPTVPSRPPLHPALAHIPIGAWICSLLFDVFSHLVSRPGDLAEGAAWLIATGVLSAVAAAAAGIADLRWIRPGSPAFRTASAHMTINVSLIFAYAVNFGLRYRSHSLRAPVSPGLLAFSVVCVLALGVSGFLGGRLAYGHGVRVNPGAESRVRVPQRRW